MIYPTHSFTFHCNFHCNFHFFFPSFIYFSPLHVTWILVYGNTNKKQKLLRPPAESSNLLCHIILYVLCGTFVLVVGYLIFRATNDGRCVDLTRGIEFNTSFIATKSLCESSGFTWVYEPFSEEPRNRFDPYSIDREKLNIIARMRQDGRRF